MLTIDGARIYLRDHQVDDLQTFHAWISDPLITKYLSWRTSTIEASFVRLAQSIQDNDCTPRARYFFALILKQNDQMIGDAGFTIQTRQENGGIAEIGYFVLRPYWGYGYATEAAKLMIRYCFETLGLHKVTASCDAENLVSEKVMLNCGMRREAYRQKQSILNGQWRDRLEYAILAQNWPG